MEELMTLEEYVEQNPKVSKYILRRWIKKGLKHVGVKPVLIKPQWVDEYIEENAEQIISRKTKPKITKRLARNDMKITLEDLM